MFPAREHSLAPRYLLIQSWISLPVFHSCTIWPYFKYSVEYLILCGITRVCYVIDTRKTVRIVPCPERSQMDFFFCSSLILDFFPHPYLPTFLIYHAYLSLPAPEILSFYLHTYSALKAFRSDLPSFLFTALFNCLGSDPFLYLVFFPLFCP